MACPTCSATMSQLGCRTSGNSFFLCPRCGTYKTCDGTVGRPALVDFCRGFLVALWSQSTVGGAVSMADIKAAWERLGIRESINTEGERP